MEISYREERERYGHEYIVVRFGSQEDILLLGSSCLALLVSSSLLPCRNRVYIFTDKSFYQLAFSSRANCSRNKDDTSQCLNASENK